MPNRNVTSVVAKRYAGTTYYYLAEKDQRKLIKMTIQPEIVVKVHGTYIVV